MCSRTSRFGTANQSLWKHLGNTAANHDEAMENSDNAMTSSADFLMGMAKADKLLAVLLGSAFATCCVFLYYIVKHSDRPTKGKKSDSKSRRVIVLGLEGSGKSSIISRLPTPQKESKPIVPTEGFNVLQLQADNITFNIWEVGGRKKSYWQSFIEDANLLVFVVDSTSEMDKLKEAVNEFNGLLDDKRLKDKPVLILANKQNCANAKSDDEIGGLFGCEDGMVKGHIVKCFGTTATTDSKEAESSIWEARAAIYRLSLLDG